MKALEQQMPVGSRPPHRRHSSCRLCPLCFVICHLSFELCHLSFVICHLSFFPHSIPAQHGSYGFGASQLLSVGACTGLQQGLDGFRVVACSTIPTMLGPVDRPA